jgi:hypothetical protein
LQKSVPNLTKNITIVINEGRRSTASFTVPESLLTEKSQYFKAACRGSWKEATSRVMKLQDIDADAFESYIYWVYRSELAIDTSYDAETTGHDVEAAEHVDQLVVLWLLGDRLADCKLRNAVMEAISSVLSGFNWTNHAEAFRPGMTCLIWDSITKGRALRRLVMDHYIAAVTPGELDEDWDEHHPESIKGLAMSSLGCGSYEGEDSTRCGLHTYHEDDDDNVVGKDAGSKMDIVD